MKPHCRRLFFPVVAAGVVVLGGLVATGCSNDSGPTNIILTPPCMTFTPAASPAAGTVTAQVNAAESTCDVVELDLIVTGVSDIIGASFDISYGIAGIQFVGLVIEDSFLGTDGTDIVSEWQDDPLGEVSVGLTRLTGDPPTGASPTTGDEALVRLRFVRLVSEGTGQVEFQLETLQAPGTPPTTIPNVTWFGGTFNITIDEP